MKHIFNLVKETNKETHVYNLETQRLALGNIIKTMILPISLLLNFLRQRLMYTRLALNLWLKWS